MVRPELGRLRYCEWGGAWPRSVAWRCCARGPVLARGDLPADEFLAGPAAGALGALGDEPRLSVAPDSLFVGLHALYWLTANLASHTPVLMCVDDVICCDEASLRFLEFLVRRLEGVPVTVVLVWLVRSMARE